MHCDGPSVRRKSHCTIGWPWGSLKASGSSKLSVKMSTLDRKRSERRGASTKTWSMNTAVTWRLSAPLHVLVKARALAQAGFEAVQVVETSRMLTSQLLNLQTLKTKRAILLKNGRKVNAMYWLRNWPRCWPPYCWIRQPRWFCLPQPFTGSQSGDHCLAISWSSQNGWYRFHATCCPLWNPSYQRWVGD